MLIRSTMLKTAKRCERLFYWKYIAGIYPKITVKRGDLYFGVKMHEAIDKFHKGGYEAGLRVFDDYDLTEATKDKNPQSGRMLYDDYVSNPFDMVSTEKEFKFLVGSHTWGGRFDGICEMKGGLYVVDHKTTRWGFRQFKPNDQFISYYLGAKIFYPEVIGVIVNELNVDKGKCERRIITYNKEEVDEWLKETKVFISYICRCKSSGIWPKTADCYKYGNRECPYHVLCTANSEGMRNRLMERLFVKRENPIDY